MNKIYFFLIIICLWDSYLPSSAISEEGHLLVHDSRWPVGWRPLLTRKGRCWRPKKRCLSFYQNKKNHCRLIFFVVRSSSVSRFTHLDSSPRKRSSPSLTFIWRINPRQPRVYGFVLAPRPKVSRSWNWTTLPHWFSNIQPWRHQGYPHA